MISATIKVFIEKTVTNDWKMVSQVAGGAAQTSRAHCTTDRSANVGRVHLLCRVTVLIWVLEIKLKFTLCPKQFVTARFTSRGKQALVYPRFTFIFISGLHSTNAG